MLHLHRNQIQVLFNPLNPPDHRLGCFWWMGTLIPAYQLIGMNQPSLGFPNQTIIDS